MAIDGNMAIRPTLFLALSADHRLLDGVEAVRFLQQVAQVTEEPHSQIPPWRVMDSARGHSGRNALLPVRQGPPSLLCATQQRMLGCLDGYVQSYAKG